MSEKPQLPTAVLDLVEVPEPARQFYEEAEGTEGQKFYRLRGWSEDTGAPVAPVPDLESMTEAEKAAYVDTYGLIAFKRIVATAGEKTSRAMEKRLRGF